MSKKEIEPKALEFFDTGAEVPCGLDGCMYTHTAESAWTEHDWHDTIDGRSVGGKPRAVTVYAVVGAEREPDEIAVMISSGDDHDAEAWLTISDAEYLIYALGSAVRRVTTYREVTR